MNWSLIHRLRKQRWKTHSSLFQDSHRLVKAESCHRVSTVADACSGYDEKQTRDIKLLMEVLDGQCIISCHLFWLLLILKELGDYHLTWYLEETKPTFVENSPYTGCCAKCFTCIILSNPWSYPSGKIPVLFSFYRRGHVPGKGQAGFKFTFCIFKIHTLKCSLWYL